MDYLKPEKVYRINMGPAKFTVDLTDGSERGEYVDQDYILHALKRPHRAINLMYCYYPDDKEWPQRISEAPRDREVGFAWDYPYEDYFPYGGGITGSQDAEVFRQIKDIRRHGMDVILTLTIDPHLSDEKLRGIGRDLRKFGRMQVRINHEATGDWFPFTKRASYEEIGKFFVRAAELIREEAPNVKVVMCIGGIEDLNSEKMVKEEEFKCTVPAADIWSVDKYLSLHWGWPYDVAERGGYSFARYNVEEVYEKTKRSFLRFRELNGGEGKPMVMAELNSDGDVVGPYGQAAMLSEFAELMRADSENWLTGFTFYQFRDRGRLGLEVEDPNNKYVGIKTPLMDTYIALMHEEDFMPVFKNGEEIKPVDGKINEELRYGSFEDAEGICEEIKIEGVPVFCEAYFDEDSIDDNIIMEFNGRWFYKAPGTKCIDFMESFFETPVTTTCTKTLRLFYPTATGENDLSVTDGAVNTYKCVKSLPKIRMEYAPVVSREEVMMPQKKD